MQFLEWRSEQKKINLHNLNNKIYKFNGPSCYTIFQAHWPIKIFSNSCSTRITIVNLIETIVLLTSIICFCVQLYNIENITFKCIQTATFI